MYISYQNLQLVEYVNLFQKVEDDIRRNLFEEHFQRIYIQVLFSHITIRSEQESIACSSERCSSQAVQKGASSPFNKNK